MQEPDINKILAGSISDSAKALIEKIGDAVGGIFKPIQIRRVARADADALKIKAMAQLEIWDELQQRAVARAIKEESLRQINMEQIVAMALPMLQPTARPHKIDNDLLVYFFEQAKLVSNQDIQMLWSRILAGEANQPGSFSKRTLQTISTIEKADAEMFEKLCNFEVVIDSIKVPMVLDKDAEIYKNNGLSFSILQHLEVIGLINFDWLTGYILEGQQKQFHFSRPEIHISYDHDGPYRLKIGQVRYTNVGAELANICNVHFPPGFMEYLVSQLSNQDLRATPLKVTS